MQEQKSPLEQDALAAEVWDELLASSQIQGSTPASAIGAARLRLSRLEQRTYLPRVDRVLARIDPLLRQTIRELVTGQAPWPLFLSGKAGVGKSCSALCLLDHTKGGLYYTAAGLCDLMIRSQQGRYTEPGETGPCVIWPEQIWRWIGKAPLVVLDELGTRENVSDHHYETVRRCIDERLGLPFVLISNLELDQLARVYDDRVSSRLAAGTRHHLTGPDRRVNR